MFVRKSFSGFVVAALAGSALAMGASPASAAVDPDDPSFTPVAGDLIGVGSDTSQHAMHLLAGAYNAQTPTPTARIASFAATGAGNIAIPGGDIARPNGSGAGKALLFGAGNDTDVDFARSSSALSTTEVSAGLQNFPFALDTLVMAVSGSTPSHAPAALTPTQIVDIYEGDVTNWNEVGGTAGVIAPKIPQAGSGTRSFFTAQLQAMNGGVAVTLAGSVVEVQEHDDTTVKNDANAIAPFSKGRAGLLGTLRIENGFAADRALYNVVRGADIGAPAIQTAFAGDGFICSTAARPLIEQAGFKQLARADAGGVCGEVTQDPTSNFTLNEAVVTRTRLVGTSTRARQAKLVATVTGSTAPNGTVDFFEGATQIANNVPLVSGQATKTVAGVAGNHSYKAVFTPQGGSVFEPSQATRAVKVKTSSTLRESFPAKVNKGKRATGTLTVALARISQKATGRVTITLGKKVVGRGNLRAGKVTIKLAKLPQGMNTLKAAYAGDGNSVGIAKTFTIKQKK